MELKMDGECTNVRVTLLEGSECFHAKERMKEYLLSVDDDQMLYNFRTTAGLSTKGADCMTGWDAPDGLLRGHTTGHYLSALACAYHSDQDGRMKRKAEYMVESLAGCQEALSHMQGVKDGFLSAYKEEQFDLLEKYTPYPRIWAPYYTLHKILAGLLDCYEYAGIAKALDIAEGIGVWVWRRLSRLPDEQRIRMWSLYIAGEFGGINAELFRLGRITGKTVYVRCARLFDNENLLEPMEKHRDVLAGMHANQHIPQMLGALELYKCTGERRYYDAARFFWETVTEAHIYATGGTGEKEIFHGKGEIGAYLTDSTQETCASYNMLKLTSRLFQYEWDSRYMDYYEQALLNHILVTQDKRVTGESTYFLPVQPGAIKEFKYENSCCHGTGMESPFRYRDGIYHLRDGCVYVNLFLPSELRWEDQDMTVRQTFDTDHTGRIALYIKGSGRHTVKIRKPGWCREDCRILCGGKAWDFRADEKGYLEMSQDFTDGVELKLELPFHYQLVRTPDRPDLAAVRYGPYILAARSDSREFISLPSAQEYTEEALESFCRGMQMVPLWEVGEEAYHVYFLLHE